MAADIDVNGGVRAEGLRKSYGSTVAVDGLDLDIRSGEVVALLGPNGAGKSTTIDLLLGLTKPDAGSVRIWGVTPSQACAAGLVGAMLQGGGVMGATTVRELVQLMRRLSPAPLSVDEVVQMAQLDDIIDKRADRLSGGQVQRVRFGLAIAGDPQLLVLDEPTAAMDVAARRMFWTSMHVLTARGRTVLFATHYLDEADEYADRVVLLAAGQVVADDTPGRIKARTGGRVIRAVLPSAEQRALQLLPGVAGVELHGDVVRLRCTDSDAALWALMAGWPAARDIEVTSQGLDEAFLTLTTPAPSPLAQPEQVR
ncbi:MAG: ABC transporter ATP-binding protein [Actinomycetota bacterium]